MKLITLDFPAPSTPTGPAILVMPGLRQSVGQFAQYSGLRDVGIQLGRRVVFATAHDLIWNYYDTLLNPQLGLLADLIKSLDTGNGVDVVGESAGAVMIYSFLCWSSSGPVNRIQRVVSYSGEAKWNGTGKPLLIVRALVLSNAQDRLVSSYDTDQLVRCYSSAGCVVKSKVIDPPTPWPDYPGASLGHFYASDQVNQQYVIPFLGAT